MPKQLRIISMILAIVLMALSISSCSFLKTKNNTRSETIPQTKATEQEQQSYIAKNPKYGYNSLQTSGEQDLYNRMSIDVNKVQNEIGDNGKNLIEKMYVSGDNMTEANIRIVLEAFLMDNPQVFWVDNTFSYLNSKGTISVQLYSIVNNATKEKYAKQLESIVTSIILSMPKGLNEFERELYLHNYVLKICEYNNSVTTDDESWIPFTIYGSLVNGNAVCEGYAKAIEYLFSKVGIECITINGYGKDSLHKWNLVKLEDEWYHLDATWNDNNGDTVYDYFNVTDEQIKYDHKISDNFMELSADAICGDTDNPLATMFNLYSPKCTAKKYNFYEQKSTKLTGYDKENDQTIVNGLVAAAEKKEKKLYLEITNGINYEDALNSLFYEYPYKYNQYVKSANKKLENVSINSETSFINKKRFNVIEIFLNYTEK